MGRLPTELTDSIIDFHHSDRTTLKICSLVCRNWIPASRFHLFRTVRVRFDTVHTFADLLASPSSTIARHVHTLHIHFDSFVGIPVFDRIAPYLENFVSIKSISLQGLVLASEYSRSRAFGIIGNMELETVSYDFHYRWFALWFTLGNSGPFTFSSQLRVLRSALDGTSAPSSWLPIVSQFPTVGEVRLTSIERFHLPTAQATLKSGGPSIHTIGLDLSPLQPDIGMFNYDINSIAYY
jgi:hypothetical protein